MANNANHVTFGSPKVGGVVFWAPSGSTLPTDATTALDAAFLNVGYISDDGIENAPKLDTSEIKEMGGTTVLTKVTGYSETYKFTMLEVLGANANKLTYGAGAVTANTDGTVKSVIHAIPQDAGVLVIELALTGGYAARFVLPNETVSDIGSTKLVGTDAFGYETTVAANPDPSLTTTDGRIGTSVMHVAAPSTGA